MRERWLGCLIRPSVVRSSYHIIGYRLCVIENGRSFILDTHKGRPDELSINDDLLDRRRRAPPLGEGELKTRDGMHIELERLGFARPGVLDDNVHRWGAAVN
jgi:hypothetical protein